MTLCPTTVDSDLGLETFSGKVEQNKSNVNFEMAD